MKNNNEINEDELELTEEQLAAQEFARRNELESEPNDLRKGALGMLAVCIRAFRLVKNYDGNKAMAEDCLLAIFGEGKFNTFQLASGDTITLDSAVNISKKYSPAQDDSLKATATKCMRYLQDRCGLPPMPGQREQSSCVNMGSSRKEQLAES